MAGRGGGGDAGGGRRNPRFIHETPPSDPFLSPPPSTPLTGGEFLLQLLRQPPKSQSSANTTPIPIGGDHFRYEDPSVAAVRPGVLQFSPPGFSDIDRQQLPPWLLPHLPPSQLQNAGFSQPGFSPPRFSPPLPPGFSQSQHGVSLDHKGGPFPRGNHESFLERESQQLGFRKGNFSGWDRQIESREHGQSRVGNNSHRRVTSDSAREKDRRFVNGKIADGVSSHEFTRNVNGQSDLYNGDYQRYDGVKVLSSSLEDQRRHEARRVERWAQESSSRIKGSLGLEGPVNDGTRRQSGNHCSENGTDIARKDISLQFGRYIAKEKLQGHSHVDIELEYAGGLPHDDRNVSFKPKVRKPSEGNDDREGISAGKRPSVEDCLKVESFASKITLEEDDVLIEQLAESLTIGEEHVEKNELKTSGSRSKDFRSDFSRGQNVSSQRMRIRRGAMGCRHDIRRLTPLFLSIYKSLVPPEEEIARQNQFLTSLKQLVNKEWPDADLHIYGSCANSFGVSNSDIDICLAIDDAETSKSDILLRLADILQLEKFENVQALTRARVPIVKLMDPGSGISCDICVNNLLAVVNTKLLRDYAQVDERLRQLAFLVKHWAKSREVNETYQGTLSSYAYVLMCIHFLQQRRPPILPCLQEMRATYAVTVEGIECAFFDKVEELRNFGSSNKETVAELLWAFFNYWAFQHDYTNDVISVRTGSIISKQSKDWTKRIGNDRHLICIEDPFEISHDLGRVVDKRSIRILREEFERAANILRDFQNPSDMLFHRYVRESTES